MVKKPNKNNFTSTYFGFLSAFSILILFFMAEAILGLIKFPSKIYSIILALIIYLLCLKFSYNYASYDKKLKRSLIYSTAILWIAFLIILGIIYLI